VTQTEEGGVAVGVAPELSLVQLREQVLVRVGSEAEIGPEVLEVVESLHLLAHPFKKVNKKDLTCL